MTDQSMLGEIRRIQVTDHNIWIDHGREFYIYRFSRTGKFLNRIGSIGQGPGEYVNYLTFLVDEDKKEVYIFSTNNGVLVYDFEGRFNLDVISCFLLELHPNSVITSNNNIYFITIYLFNSFWELVL